MLILIPAVCLPGRPSWVARAGEDASHLMEKCKVATTGGEKFAECNVMKQE